MEYLSADKILVVDLETAEMNEDELSEELVEEKIGGAAIAKHLYEKYQGDDPIVIGTGLLTGTLYPASASAVITSKSPVTGKICHSPITLKVGLECQYAGFDYIVIKGKADKPSFLWVHDGVADISDASNVWGKDVWKTTDSWRQTMGDDLIQTLVIGKAGEEESNYAQVCLNYWASGDRFGFGKLFGSKKLKGIAFRGMGLLEIDDPEEFVDLALEVLSDVKEGEFVGKKGIGDICTAMGEEDVNEWLEPLVHRHSACYNTPYATNTFVYLDEVPSMLEESENEDPGFLITDIFGLIGFKKAGFSAEDACRLLKSCTKYGIDATAVAELSMASGKKSVADIEASFSNLSGEATIAGKGIFSPWCPVTPLFDDFNIDGDVDDWWEKRQAVAYIFGIHPIFAVMSSVLTEENMLELATVGTDIELTQETLNNMIEYLCA